MQLNVFPSLILFISSDDYMEIYGHKKKQKLYILKVGKSNDLQNMFIQGEKEGNTSFLSK